MPLKSKEMIQLLKSKGFIEIPCGNGSHRKLENPLTKKTVIIPYHSRELGKDLEQAILKQAGLKI